MRARLRGTTSELGPLVGMRRDSNRCGERLSVTAASLNCMVAEEASDSWPSHDSELITPPLEEDCQNTAPATRARYDYQDECIALTILEHLADDLDGVYIEHATDLILVPVAGPPELISIKHREPHHSGGSHWTWNSLKKDAVLADLYNYWISAQKSCSTAFLSNAGMSGPAQLIWKAAAEGNRAAAGKVASRLARELKISEKNAAEFLSSFSMPRHPLPRRNEIPDVGIRRTGEYLKQCGRNANAAELCYRALVAKIKSIGTDEPRTRIPEAHRVTAPTVRRSISSILELKSFRRYLDAQEIHDIILSEADTSEALAMPSTIHPGWEQDPLFTGRDVEILELSRLLKPGAPGPVAPVVIHGMSGAGKTSLAVQFAARHREKFPKVAILDGTSRASLVAGLDAMSQNPSERDPGLEQLRGPVAPSLPGNSATLLIVDGVTEAEVLQGIIPRRSNCRVIITSTIHHIDDGYDHMPLGVWRREESKSYIGKTLRGATQEDFEHLADVMGDHPLALVQAVNYCNTVSISIPEYLDRLQKNPIGLLSKGHASGHPVTVARSIELACEAVRQRDELAMELLTILAYLGAEPFPLSIFSDNPLDPAVLETKKESERARKGVFSRRQKPKERVKWGGLLASGVAQHARDSLFVRENLDAAVSKLASFALVHINQGHVTTHSLVQRVVRSRQHDSKPWIAAAVGLCVGPLAKRKESRAADFYSIIGHAEALLFYALSVNFEGPAVVVLANEISSELCNLGDPQKGLHFAEMAYEIVHSSYARGIAPERAVFQARVACMTALRLLGGEERAISLARANIDLMQGSLRGAAANLLYAYSWLGKVAAWFSRSDLAAEVLEHLPDPLKSEISPEVELREEVIFAIHVRTQMLYLLSRFSEAQSVNRWALKKSKFSDRISSPVDSVILNGDAALIARSSLDPENRVKSMRSVLRALEEQYASPQRSDRVYLDYLLQAADAELDLYNYKESEVLLNRAESIIEKKFGKDGDVHTVFLANRGRCQMTRVSMLGGSMGSAIEDLTASISRMEAVRGRVFLPELAAALINLSQAYALIGDEGNALEVAERALEIDIELYGSDHPEVLIDRQIVAATPTTVRLAKQRRRWTR